MRALAHNAMRTQSCDLYSCRSIIDNVVAKVKLFSRYTSNSMRLKGNRTFVMPQHIGSFKHSLCPLQWLMKLSVSSSKQENTRNLLSIMDVSSSSLQSAGAF